MATAIQISEKFKKKLEEIKTHSNERYEDVIWVLIEYGMEMNKDLIKEIEEAKNR